MNNLGFLLVIAGLVFLIYAIICKNKISIYNRSDKLIIVNEKEFFKLQFIFSLFNSLAMIIFGVTAAFYNLSNFSIVVYPFVFRIINGFLIPVSRGRNIIEYK